MNAITLEAVRAKIIEAVPEIARCSVCRREYKDDCFINHTGQHVGRPITLEDVLRAIKVIEPMAFMETGIEVFSDGSMTWRGKPCEVKENWHLGKTLDEQSPETISFLHKILV